MDLFSWISKPAAQSAPRQEIQNKNDAAPDIGQSQPTAGARPAPPPGSRRRLKIYSVRVHEGFESEIWEVQSQIHLERRLSQGKARKVSAGEIMELMLEALKTARRNGEVTGHALPIADDVWIGLRQIAQHMDMSPADVFEQLVVEKFVALDLPPPK
jgi:hypothetical protein